MTGVSLDKKSVSLVVGETETLQATVTPDNADNKSITYSSSDATIASVTPKAGKITAIKEGNVDITVTTEDGNKTDVSKVAVKAESGE
ncbi:MAG: Ig-like domain-containing protein [Vagococcus sp.]|uniref:Ig-like domain-containing protein n=1 Tax=Vagococcus sp. TaxID=1933889 RepID=UPI002FCC1E81